MKMYELQKLTDQIEKDTNRKLKLIGEVLSTGRPIIHLYFNDWLVGTFFLNELREILIRYSFFINGLKFGKNPVEF
jgi:hypothetical protein